MNWKWKQWLDKAGELYRNVVRLWKLQGGGDSFIPPAQPTKAMQRTKDPYAMDVDRINHSPGERAEHMRKQLCFICHREGCH